VKKQNVEDIVEKLELMKENLERLLHVGSLESYDYVSQTYLTHLEKLWYSGERGDVFRQYIRAKKSLDEERKNKYPGEQNERHKTNAGVR